MSDMSETSTAEPTDDDLAMVGIERGDPAKGEMCASDGDTECADCSQPITKGQSVYWQCSMQNECDPYCAPCVIQSAQSMRAICAGLESGELQP